MTNSADYNREPRDVLHLEIVDDGVERPYAQKQKVRNRQSKRENAEVYYCADCSGKTTTTTGIAYHDTDYDRTDCHYLIKERYLAENTRTSYHESNLIALVRRRRGQSEQTDIEQPDDREVDIEIQESSTS